MRQLLIFVFGALTLILDAPGRAASILFVGNSFTYGELSDVKHYRPESVHDLNNEGIWGQVCAVTIRRVSGPSRTCADASSAEA